VLRMHSDSRHLVSKTSAVEAQIQTS
jgi:hypothetical protein